MLVLATVRGMSQKQDYWTKKCERRDDCKIGLDGYLSFGSASKIPLKKKLRKPSRRPARFLALYTYYTVSSMIIFGGFLPPAEGFMLYPPSAGEIPKKNKNNRTGNCKVPEVLFKYVLYST